MSKITLAILVILITLIPLSLSSAQESGAAPDYGGSVIGGGIGFHTSATYWYWYNSTDPIGSREHWPIHVHSRTILSGFYEKRSLLKMGQIAGNLKIEGLIGFMGGTKEDWLPLNETISDGGVSTA